MFTQSTHLSKDCYLQLVLNPHCSKVAGLQVHGTTPIFVEYAVGIFLAVFQVFKLVIFLNISEEAGVFLGVLQHSSVTEKLWSSPFSRTVTLLLKCYEGSLGRRICPSEFHKRYSVGLYVS